MLVNRCRCGTTWKIWPSHWLRAWTLQHCFHYRGSVWSCINIAAGYALDISSLVTHQMMDRNKNTTINAIINSLQLMLDTTVHWQCKLHNLLYNVKQQNAVGVLHSQRSALWRNPDVVCNCDESVARHMPQAWLLTWWFVSQTFWSPCWKGVPVLQYQTAKLSGCAVEC